MNEETRVLGAFMFVQLMWWMPACLGHYWGRETPSHPRIKAPTWFRKIFGDLRSYGTLSMQSVAIQIVVYIVTIVVGLKALASDLSRPFAILLCFLQFILSAIAVAAGYIINHRLQR